MTAIYLAQPIDLARNVGSDVKDYWEAQAGRVVGQIEGDVTVYRPAQAFTVMGGIEAEYISSVNAEALVSADQVVAILPRGVATIGTVQEIDYAVNKGMDVTIITDIEDGSSVSLAGWVAQGAQVVSVFGPGEAEEEPVVEDPDPYKWPEITLKDMEGRGYEPLPVRALDFEAQPPSRAYSDDAGLDLYVSEARDVPPGQFVDIPCGVAVQLPDWAWGYLTGRSSTLRKRGLLVNPGVIDTGYRGELFAGVWNLTGETVRVASGERIAQLIVLENSTRRLEVKMVSTLEAHRRGNNGFGSSGS